MSKYNYPTLSYFLQAYWNQNGDIIYGVPEAAARDFVKLESDEQRDKLLMEIELSIDRKLIQPHMTWETCCSWWSQHDVLINVKEALEILIVLRRSSSRENPRQ